MYTIYFRTVDNFDGKKYKQEKRIHSVMSFEPHGLDVYLCSTLLTL